MECSKGRPVGGTEYSWCRAVPGGTGIAVLAILTSKNPETLHLQNAVKKLQNSHPILRSRLHTNPNKNTFSLVTSSTPFVQVKSFNLSSTAKILENMVGTVSPLQLILEHELNENPWSCNGNVTSSLLSITDLLFATTYCLPNGKWVAVFRLHVSACDRTTAVSLLRELLVLVSEEGGDEESLNMKKGEVSLGIEDLVPPGKIMKGLWTRGMNMLAYSMNSFRLTNLKFIDAKSPRSSQVVRFQMNKQDTERVLTRCNKYGIKLCGALSAAGLIAAHNSKRHADHQNKYGVVTLIDCRALLEPPLSNHHFGFYHSAILNTHVMKGGENVWELAKKMYMSFENSKKCNRHFTDMADLNFLMCRAIENPGLTSSSSLRTSFMSVFEDTVIDNSNGKQEIGLEDYIGCASVHGIGPSIALFDTIRDGELDCVCVYPWPLHSREQMQTLVDSMMSVLVNASDR